MNFITKHFHNFFFFSPLSASLKSLQNWNLPRGTNTLKTTVLAVVLVTVSEFPASLARHRLAHARVDAFRRRPSQRVRRRGLHRLLSVSTLDVIVVGLAARLVGRVGGEGLAGGCGAGGVGLRVEFLLVVCRGGLDTRLVLLKR